MNTLYLILNAVTISFPLVRSFESRIQYMRKWKALAPGLILTAVFFIAWDIIFTKSGIWGFNPNYLIGVYFLSLPMEEWLFFITVPFASIFIYECVVYFLRDMKAGKWLPRITSGIASGLICISVLNTGRSYTFWSFLFGGTFLLVISLQKPHWLGWFWITYLLHLIPFFIVNGILTGSFIDEYIVWYNDQENLSIRLHTIPIEDSVYALLLLLMNVTFFEWFKKFFLLPEKHSSEH